MVATLNEQAQKSQETLTGSFLIDLTQGRVGCYPSGMATRTPDHLKRFRVWVDEQGGPTKAAAKLDTSRPTVDNLLNGSAPNLKTAKAIEDNVGIAPREWV